MDALRRDIHIPRAFTALLLWVCEMFAGFPFTKTSANKRFLYYVRKPINRITGAKVVIFCEMSKCLRRKLKDGGNFFRTLVNLFRKAILRKSTFSRCGVGAVFFRCSLGVLSVESGKV